MMNNSGLTSFKLSLVFSILFHVSLFLIFKTQIEHRQYDIYMPIQMRVFEREPVKEPAKKKLVKKEKEKVNIKKTPRKEKVTKKTPEPEPEPQKKPQQTTGIIEIPNFPYPWYLNSLRKKIGNNWDMPVQPEDMVGKKAVIYFRIKRGGEVSGIRIETRSGISELDISGLRAVKESMPFIPLPSEFKEEYLIVHFYFKIK